MSTPLHIVLVTTEIDAPSARVAISHHRALHGIYESVVLTEGEVELGIHAGTAEDVVQEIERHAAVVMHIVGLGAYHHVGLMGMFLHHDGLPFGGIGFFTLHPFFFTAIEFFVLHS